MYYTYILIYIYDTYIIHIYYRMCAVPLPNHLRAAADAFRPLGTYQRY